jgi:hypothetical protein
MLAGLLALAIDAPLIEIPRERRSGVAFTEQELRASNPHLYKSMIDRQAEAKTIAEFKRLEIGWTMLLDDGWWAYYNDEKALGPSQQKPKLRGQVLRRGEKKRPQEASPEAERLARCLPLALKLKMTHRWFEWG